MAETLQKPAKRATAPPARKRGRYAKSGETREKILAAALTVAGASAFHRASVAAIAEEAGVALGNLHYHFGSRDELLYELMRWLVGELLGEVRGAIAKHDDFFAKDEAAFRAYLAYVRRNPPCVRLAEEVRLHHPKLYDETNAMWLAMFRDAIGEGVERGQLRPMGDDEIGVLANLLLGARYFVDQLIHGAGRGRGPSDDLLVATYTSLTRGGLRSGTHAGAAPTKLPAEPSVSGRSARTQRQKTRPVTRRRPRDHAGSLGPSSLAERSSK